MAIKIIQPDENTMYAVRAFLLNKPGLDCVSLSVLFGEKGEICLEPAKARKFTQVCLELAGSLTALANQAQGIKFPNK